MTDFIKWCNDNNGFLTAILSIIGLFLSIIAMVVSIRTARLPYKKKLLLGSSLLLAAEVTIGGDVRTFIAGLSASATNVGNRPVNLTYLGYAIKKDGKFKKIYPLNRRFDSKAMLAASEMLEVHFQTDELLKAFEKEDRNTRLYVFVYDTEGTEHKRKAGTVGKLMDNLRK